MPLNIPGYPFAEGKANATPQVNDHPAHHNALAGGVNALREQLLDTPDRLDSLDSAVANLSDRRGGWRERTGRIVAGSSTTGQGEANAAVYRVIDGMYEAFIDFDENGGTLPMAGDNFLRYLIDGTDGARRYSQVRFVGFWRGNFLPNVSTFSFGPLVYTRSSPAGFFIMNNSGNVIEYSQGQVITGSGYGYVRYPTTESDTV